MLHSRSVVELPLAPDQFQALRNAVLQQGAALFLDRSFQAPPSFQDLVQTKYGGQTQSVSFSTPTDAQDVINRWVQDQTQHQVQNLLSTLDRQTQMLLVSAAAYQSESRLQLGFE